MVLRSFTWVGFFSCFPLAVCLAPLDAMRASPHKHGFHLRSRSIFLIPVYEVDSVLNNMDIGAECYRKVGAMVDACIALDVSWVPMINDSEGGFSFCTLRFLRDGLQPMGEHYDLMWNNFTVIHIICMLFFFIFKTILLYIPLLVLSPTPVLLLPSLSLHPTNPSTPHRG